MWGNWNSRDHPVGYPAAAHWSPLVGVASSANFKLFMAGQQATPGVVMVAEMGNPTTLLGELGMRRMNNGSVLSYMRAAAGTPNGVGTGFMTVTVYVDSAHPYVSTISMIAPSSDFFVGVSSANMCQPLLRPFFFDHEWLVFCPGLVLLWCFLPRPVLIFRSSLSWWLTLHV